MGDSEGSTDLVTAVQNSQALAQERGAGPFWASASQQASLGEKATQGRTQRHHKAQRSQARASGCSLGVFPFKPWRPTGLGAGKADPHFHCAPELGHREAAGTQSFQVERALPGPWLQGALGAAKEAWGFYIRPEWPVSWVGRGRLSSTCSCMEALQGSLLGGDLLPHPGLPLS